MMDSYMLELLWQELLFRAPKSIDQHTRLHLPLVKNQKRDARVHTKPMN
jgi:hypothetical protein